MSDHNKQWQVEALHLKTIIIELGKNPSLRRLYTLFSNNYISLMLKHSRS